MKARRKLFKKYFKKSTGKVNHEVLDLINQDYNNAILRAKQFLQIEEDNLGGPITISVPDSYLLNDRVKVKNVVLEDKTNKIVYDQTLLSVLLFGEDKLNYYQANLDHRSGFVDFDVAGQIPYKHIVHIQQSFSYDNPSNPKIQHFEVEINLADGSVIPFRLRNKYLTLEDSSESLLTQQEADLVKTLNSVLS